MLTEAVPALSGQGREGSFSWRVSALRGGLSLVWPPSLLPLTREVSAGAGWGPHRTVRCSCLAEPSECQGQKIPSWGQLSPRRELWGAVRPPSPAS